MNKISLKFLAITLLFSNVPIAQIRTELSKEEINGLIAGATLTIVGGALGALLYSTYTNDGNIRNTFNRWKEKIRNLVRSNAEKQGLSESETAQAEEAITAQVINPVQDSIESSRKGTTSPRDSVAQVISVVSATTGQSPDAIVRTSSQDPKFQSLATTTKSTLAAKATALAQQTQSLQQRTTTQAETKVAAETQPLSSLGTKSSQATSQAKVETLKAPTTPLVSLESSGTILPMEQLSYKAKAIFNQGIERGLRVLQSTVQDPYAVAHIKWQLGQGEHPETQGMKPSEFWKTNPNYHPNIPVAYE